MKKIIIISIIMFCLFSFMEISCLANEPSSPGEFWNTSTVTVKVVYVLGFKQGIEMSLNKLSPTIDAVSDGGKAWDELVSLYNFIDEHGAAILTVMEDLYKDPANTYIPLHSICEIAYQKLKGEDIAPLLRELRKKALL